MSSIKHAVETIFGSPTQTAVQQGGTFDAERQDGGEMVILLIEDNPGDAKLTSIMLGAHSGAFCLEICDRLQAGLERLAKGGVDALLLDLSLPDSHGIETFKRVRSVWPNLPIVVFSSDSDEKIAIRAVRMGAQDYLIKGRVDEEALGRALQFAIGRQEKINTLAGTLSSIQSN
jgi:two-component system, cell cycle response regulator